MVKKFNPYSLEQPEGFGGGAASTGRRATNLFEKEAEKAQNEYIKKQIPRAAAAAGVLGTTGALVYEDLTRDRQKAKPAKPTTAEQQMIQEEKDKQMAPKLEDAYNRSLTSTEAAPQKKAKGGVTRADGCITKGHTRGKMV